MTNFAADMLRELRDLQEVTIRTEKHPESAVVIWIAVDDDEVFVRSVRGTNGAGTETSRRAGALRWNLPAAGCRSRRSPRAIPMRSPAPAANT